MSQVFLRQSVRDVVRTPFGGVITPDADLQDWGFDVRLPFERLCVFGRAITDSSPVVRMPVVAYAVLGIASPRTADGAAADHTDVLVCPLGVVGTDHVGYASFDLWVLRHVRIAKAVHDRLTALGLIGGAHPRPTIEITKLLVFPYKDRTIAFDAIAEGVVGPDFVALQLDMDDIMLDGRGTWPPMPAMQTPSIFDWRLSPGSFSMAGVLLIGEDGCETLLPTNLSTRLARFKQLVKTPDYGKLKAGNRDQILKSEGMSGIPELTGDYALGYSVEYQSEWFPLGHSLGRIAYSLPLAPAEKVQIAVVDWARTDTAQRQELTGLTEQLNNDTLRDRSITEAVDMVVRESQSGNSFMAGLGLSAGAGIPIGPVSLGAGFAGGLGGASSSTSGVRNLTGNTSQQISDAFHQAASAHRELNSTVIVQGSQAEKAGATTRTVANYNHSHALTILYYEVLHHERVLTRPVFARPVVLLREGLPAFDFTNIELNSQILDKVLINPDLRDCLKVVAKRACLAANIEREKAKRAAEGDPAEDNVLGTFSFRVLSGAVGSEANIYVNVIPKAGGTPISCAADPAMAAKDPNSGAPTPYIDNINMSPHRFAASAEVITNMTPTQSIRWNNVAQIEIGQTIAPWQHITFENRPIPDDWIISDARFTTANGADKWVMFSGAPAPDNVPWDKSIRVPVGPFTPAIQSVDDLLSDDELCCLRKLLLHLNAHRAYYWRAIWLAEDPGDRALRLTGWQLAGQPLFDAVENTLVGVTDDSIALPIASGMESRIIGDLGIGRELETFDLPSDDYVEQLLSFPTRGVFAEAKLGHCNASELIDPTRFWDWQSSPIPDDAPQISPVSTDSRAQQPSGLAPTPFPQSLVNIVNPSALPDPTGLAAAAGVMSALGPFRDMSGMQQLGAYLQTLSNNATQLASQGLKNAQTGSLMNMIKGSDELTPQQKSDLIGKLLGGQVQNVTAPPPAPSTTTPPAPSTTTPATPSTTTPATGGTTPTGTSTPAPIPTNSPAVKTPTPKPAPAASSKTKKITFVFFYDTNEVMSGTWKVTLISGGETLDSALLIDTIAGTSGVSRGDRIEMSIPSSFGGTDDVTLQMTGAIVRPPATVSSPKRSFVIDGWNLNLDPKTFRTVVKRADFDKAQTYRVVQATDAVEFTVSINTSDSSTQTTVTGTTAGLEVGVEESTEVGGSVEVASAKENVKIAAKGTFGWMSQDMGTTQTGSGSTDQVKFNGRKVANSAPSITPVL
ncbi:MAG TPA: hypothetical protein VFW50_01080 [Streptosporangiaceae bacterium]|nr:hypothetical protein [Streptosporangiaceae bacterium]